MMEMTTTMATNLLLFANATMLAAAAIAIIRFRKQARRFERFWDSPTGVSLADTQSLQSRPVAEPNAQLERRVTELQSVVKTLAKRGQDTRELENVSLPIENAVRMAKHGATIDELIRSCGLNIGEAQLLRKLHGKSNAA